MVLMEAAEEFSVPDAEAVVVVALEEVVAVAWDEVVEALSVTVSAVFTPAVRETRLQAPAQARQSSGSNRLRDLIRTHLQSLWSWV